MVILSKELNILFHPSIESRVYRDVAHPHRLHVNNTASFSSRKHEQLIAKTRTASQFFTLEMTKLLTTRHDRNHRPLGRKHSPELFKIVQFTADRLSRHKFPSDVTDGVSLKGIVECNFVPVWANKLFKCSTPKTCKQTIISID